MVILFLNILRICIFIISAWLRPLYRQSEAYRNDTLFVSVTGEYYVKSMSAFFGQQR